MKKKQNIVWISLEKPELGILEVKWMHVDKLSKLLETQLLFYQVICLHGSHPLESAVTVIGRWFYVYIWYFSNQEELIYPYS